MSIGISAMTTGFTSAMIAFDKDVKVLGRRAQPLFYGYIPDDNGLRTRCFVLMTIISALHNVSRSLGVALLAASSSKMLVVYFTDGEIALFFMVKCLRGDIWYWPRTEGIMNYLLAFLPRLAGKIIADFSGCLHFRHAYEMRGIAFSASMVWAQIMPFVALQFFEGSNKEALSIILFCSTTLWLVLNVVFFCTIDLSYLNTFFGSMTAPQYTCEVFLATTTDDATKFDFTFETRLQYTKSINKEVKEWVADNIDRWKLEKPDWFKIELIPDEFLSKEVLEAEGGANRKRRRSSGASLKEIAGLGGDDKSSNSSSGDRVQQVHPEYR